MDNFDKKGLQIAFFCSQLADFDLSNWNRLLELRIYPDFGPEEPPSPCNVCFHDLDCIRLEFSGLWGVEEYGHPIWMIHESDIESRVKSEHVRLDGQNGSIEVDCRRISYHPNTSNLGALLSNPESNYVSGFVRLNTFNLGEIISDFTGRKNRDPHPVEATEEDLKLIFSDAILIDFDLSQWAENLEIWIVTEDIWGLDPFLENAKSRLPILKIKFHELTFVELKFEPSPSERHPEWSINTIEFKNGLKNIELSGERGAPRLAVACEKITYKSANTFVLDELFPEWERRDGTLARPSLQKMISAVCNYEDKKLALKGKRPKRLFRSDENG